MGTKEDFLIAPIQVDQWLARLSANDGFAPKNIDDLFIIRQLALIGCEASEAIEGHRRDSMDKHLPHRKEMDVELADVVLRTIKFCYHMGIPLADIISEKEAYNRTRSDHKPEERNKPGGKRF